jgi:hypothetical protein
MNAFWFWIVKPLARGLAPIAAAVIVIAIIGAIAAHAVNANPLVWGLALAGTVIAGAALGIRAITAHK